MLRNPTGTNAGGLPEKAFVRSPAGTWHEITQRPVTTSGDTWGGRPASPREGDVYSVVVGGITYRKAIYRAGVWDIEVGPYPHLQALAYVAGDLVYKDRVFYTPNANIPAGTEFAEGIAGPTWRKWTANMRREITKISSGGSNGLLFVAEGRLFSARGQEGNGAWISAMSDSGRYGSYNNGIRNAYEIVIPDAGTATVVDANVVNTMAYALLSDGRLYTWGNNPNGNLGVGDLNPRYLPTLSKTGVAKVFTHHSQEQRSFDFVRMFIQDTAGEVWCCGYNGQGQLGVGSGASQSSWVKVVAAGTNPKSVWVMGSYIGFTLIQKSDGNCIIAGYGRGGGGLGVSGGAADIQSFVNANVWIGNDTSYTITQVEAGLGYNDTSANDRMNLTVLSDNGTTSRLLGCGDNSWGTVGNGSFSSNVLAPTAPTGVTGRIKKLVRIGDVVGSIHALDYDGNLWSWGYSNHGQLGRGVSVTSPTPAIAQTGIIDIFQIGASPQYGYESTGPIIQKSDGYYCCGWNGIGLVGVGHINQANSYVKMRLPAGVVLKHVGQYSTYINRFTRVAVTTDDQIFAWGYNANSNIDGVTTANGVIPIDVTPAALNR